MNVEVAVGDSCIRDGERYVAVDRTVLLVRGAAADVQGVDRGTGDVDVEIARDVDAAEKGSRCERVANQRVLDDDVDAVFKVIRSGGLRNAVEIIDGRSLEIQAVGAVAVEVVTVDVVIRDIHGRSVCGINSLAANSEPFLDGPIIRHTRRDCVCTIFKFFRSLPEDQHFPCDGTGAAKSVDRLLGSIGGVNVDIAFCCCHRISLQIKKVMLIKKYKNQYSRNKTSGA